VARLLGLPYPGGPSVSKAAATGDPKAFDFPRAFSGKENLAFSYSGLKTSVLYTLRDHPEAHVPDVAASFQWAAIDALVEKTKQALQYTNAPRLVVAGGVAANALLRERLAAETDVRLHIPPVSLCTDNGAMIAAVGYWRWRHGYLGDLKTNARANWPLAKTAV
jgi:N6-L-threonylcarbamoyladenine synthase